MRPSRPFALPALALLALSAPAVLPAPAAPPERDAAALDHFEKRVRPVLVEHCCSCHSAEAAARNKLRGGLRLDSRAGLRTGGDSGPAIVPGRPQDSLLLRTLRHEGDVKMPPRGPLPEAVLADFTVWIASGAPDPRGDATAATPAPGKPDVERGREFWAYRPLARPPVPSGEIGGEAGGEIDRFLDAARAARGLAAAPEAAPEVIVRRLYFDLSGLPPAPEEIREFAADPSPSAYERLVDRLLASPRFGERWARHWLDVARYAESVTLRGFVFPDAWRYRDWVIDAFNRDLPYDRFVREQLAGDLLPAATPADRERQLVASTYLMLGNTNLEEQDKKQLRMDVVDEQLDVIGKGLLAQTITCARCHDHKFDPIPQEDYYALAGILRNTRALEHANVSRWVEVPLPLPPAREAEVRRFEERIAALKGRIKAAKAKTPTGEAASGATADGLKALEAELKRLEKEAPRRPMALAPQEEPAIEEVRLHVRGSPHTLGPVVPRGVLRVASRGAAPRFPADASGRVQLAGWIASPDNPLTARVWVNRAWHWLFGRGLVPTVDNFGATGEPPTHPELLDWLAGEFVRDGWSTKRLVRRLVLSRAYRQASANEAARAADPDNLLWTRAPRRRLDAECLRDAMLAAAGTLAPTAGGPTFPAGLAADYGFRSPVPCRSIYLPVFRNALPELFEVFDFADPSLVTGSRGTSIVAPQALFMLNNPFVRTQARTAAARLLAEPCADDSARLTVVCQRTLGREPTPGERAVLERALASGGRSRDEAWASVVHALFACPDFRTLD